MALAVFGRSAYFVYKFSIITLIKGNIRNYFVILSRTSAPKMEYMLIWRLIETSSYDIAKCILCDISNIPEKGLFSLILRELFSLFTYSDEFLRNFAPLFSANLILVKVFPKWRKTRTILPQFYLSPGIFTFSQWAMHRFLKKKPILGVLEASCLVELQKVL